MTALSDKDFIVKLQLRPISPAQPSAASAPTNALAPNHSQAKPFDMYALVPSAAGAAPVTRPAPLSPRQLSQTNPTASATPLVIAGEKVGLTSAGSGISLAAPLQPETIRYIAGTAGGVGGAMLIGAAVGTYLALRRRAMRQHQALASGTSSDNNSINA